MKSALGALVLALLLGGIARAGEMQIHLQASGGDLLTTGLEEFTHGGAGGFSASFAWPVSDRVRLGLRQTLNISAMPFGEERNLAFLPFTAFLLKYDPVERMSMDLSLGVGLVASSELGFRSLLPHPAAGAGLELVLARYNGSSLRLRAQCDLVYMALQDPKPLLVIPQVGLLYAF